MLERRKKKKKQRYTVYFNNLYKIRRFEESRPYIITIFFFGFWIFGFLDLPLLPSAFRIELHTAVDQLLSGFKLKMIHMPYYATLFR